MPQGGTAEGWTIGKGRGRTTIRHLRTRAEYEEAARLQEAIWGDGFGERVPPALLQVAQRVGGVSAGAFDPEGRLVGFVFGISGIEDGRPVHWSDMLAVRPEWRGRGLGMRLKEFQRGVLLDVGITTAYWTFDPLEARNAYLNLARLGAVSREYVPNMYGEPSSHLHQGIGTDRLVALWPLDSPRVAERLGTRGTGGDVEGKDGSRGVGDTLAGAPAAVDREGGDDPPRPTAPRLGLTSPRVTVAIPASVQDLKDRDPELALEWRRATREAFLHYLERGFEARELERDGNIARYLLVGSE